MSDPIADCPHGWSVSALCPLCREEAIPPTQAVIEGAALLKNLRPMSDPTDAEVERIAETCAMCGKNTLGPDFARAASRHLQEMADLRRDRDEWKQQHENLLAMYQTLAALPSRTEIERQARERALREAASYLRSLIKPPRGDAGDSVDRTLEAAATSIELFALIPQEPQS